MNQTEIRTTTKMIDALLDTTSGTVSVKFGPGWLVRLSNTARILEITITHRFPHPDGRRHSSSKQTRLEIKQGTVNLAVVWLMGAVVDLQFIASDQGRNVIKVK